MTKQHPSFPEEKLLSFRDPLRLNPSIIARAESFFKNYTTRLKKHLNSPNSAVEVREIQQKSFSRFIQSLEKETFVSTWVQQPSGHETHIAIDRPILLDLPSFSAQEFSTLLFDIASDLLEFSFSASQIDPRKQAGWHGCLVTQLFIHTGSTPGLLSFILPFPTATHWFESKPPITKKKKITPVQIDTIRLTFQVILDTIPFSQEKLLKLTIGDILPLSAAPNSPISLKKEGQTVFHARPGHLGRQRAVQIELSIKESIMPNPNETNVQPATFDKLEETKKPSPSKKEKDLLQQLPLHLEVLLGQARLPIKDVLKLHTGSVIPLDTMTTEPVLLLAEGKPIAEGEVVLIEDRYGIRLTKVLSSDKP